MDRKVAYPSQLPLSADFLSVQRNTLIALAYGIQSWAGTNSIADGLTCIPTIPASLAIQITPGSICSLSALDQTAFGSLPIDVTHQVMQQGILLDAINLTLTPPLTGGQAINYLIQAQFQQSDTDASVLAYFNSANPKVPFMGPANSGTAQITTRKGIVTLQAKAGIAATAGSQVTPSPDAGYIGLYSVTVANGATTLTTSQIATIATAPFLNVKLPQVPSYVQAGAYAYGLDTGTVNAMAVTLSPVPTAYPSSIFVKKIASANTTGMTVAVNGLGVVSVINADGSALTSGQMSASFMSHLVFDGTSYRFMNGVAAVGVGSLTASAGEGIGVAAGAVALNFPSLASNPSPGNTDLVSYYNQTDVHHRTLTWLQFVTAIFGSSPGAILRMTNFTTSGTWTKGANTKNILVIGVGAGAAGGSNQNAAGPIVSSTSYINAFGANTQINTKQPAGAAGGGAGGGFIFLQNVASISSLAVVIGIGGVPVSNSQGGVGGLTSIGALGIANGGNGGKIYSPIVTVNGSNGQGGVGGTATLGGGVIGIAWNGDSGNSGGPLDGGVGGSTLLGGGGLAGDDTAGSLYGVNGGPGSTGAGGGGADATGAGGPGGNGALLVIEFS